MTTTGEHWSSRWVFLFAAVGFAVGLGNIWRFSYVVGENGGGAFIVIYVLCAFGIGVPLLMAELMIGRRGNRSPIGSVQAIARECGARRVWRGIGLLAVAAAFLILTFYAVIAGWTIDYFVRAVSGAFSGLSAAESQAMFDDFMADPLRMIFWQGAVILLAVFVNSRGINKGIEKAVQVLMPALTLCLLVMVVYGLVAGDRGAAAEFLLKPDFGEVTFGTVLIAIGQAFFSIGIAMATMMTYGAYLDRKVSIMSSATIIVSADTIVALLAGFAIFPLVFANSLEPSSGPGLIFQTLPIAFGEMPGGRIFGSVFFLLLIAAALTSCIGSFEAIIAWAREHRNINRRTAAIGSGAIVWLVGLASVFSFNELASFHPLDFVPALEGMTSFVLKDYVASNIMLPAGAIAMSLFAGWVMTHRMCLRELDMEDGFGFRLWRMIIRFLAPGILAVIMLGELFA